MSSPENDYSIYWRGTNAKKTDPARPPASAKESPRAKDLVLVGTVIKVVLRNHEPSEKERWAVTVTIDRIVSGEVSGPTFTFAIHSPGRAGLRLASCTVKATWTGTDTSQMNRTRPVHDVWCRRRLGAVDPEIGWWGSVASLGLPPLNGTSRPGVGNIGES